MSNYIKLVQSQAELTSFKASNDFITPSLLAVHNSRIADYNPYVPHDYSQDYLTFVSQESGTFKFNGNSIDYSIDDGETWTTLANNTNTPTVPTNSKIMFKATLTPTSSKGVGTFSSTGSFTTQGNVMSLLYGDNFNGQTSLSGKSYAFYKLFYNCTGLISAENISLIATTLASDCYIEMFSGCTALTTPPVLPSTTLASNCYNSMFNGCTLLTTAPELPATTLASYCYQNMFKDCTSLIAAPELPATTLAESCYENMFNGCTSLTTAPLLPATTLADYCYTSMLQDCTSLTTAPELPAITLAIQCYGSMFNGCTSLTTAPELPAMTLTTWCYVAMFAGCTSLTTAPELPAWTLTSSCYQGMFAGCTNLNSITCLATDITASNCTNSWVGGVASTGTFIKADSMTNWTTGTSGIPSGWTVQDAS